MSFSEAVQQAINDARMLGTGFVEFTYLDGQLVAARRDPDEVEIIEPYEAPPPFIGPRTRLQTLMVERAVQSLRAQRFIADVFLRAPSPNADGVVVYEEAEV